MSDEVMVEYRCDRCHKLLFRATVLLGMLEIKCKKCKALRQFTWETHKDREISPIIPEITLPTLLDTLPDDAKI